MPLIGSALMIMLDLLCVVLIIFPCKINSYGGVINVVYYELSPYIYKSENDSVSGIFPELFAELARWCDYEFKFTLDMKTPSNFSALIENKTRMKQYLNGDWLWLPLTLHISQDTKESLEFFSLDILNSFIEVLVHRDRVGPFATIKVAIFEC